MDNTRILIDAGLSEEQALIYSTLIEKGPQRASSIATWIRIKRSLVYKVLEQLFSMGLIGLLFKYCSIPNFIFLLSYIPSKTLKNDCHFLSNKLITKIKGAGYAGAL